MKIVHTNDLRYYEILSGPAKILPAGIFGPMFLGRLTIQYSMSMSALAILNIENFSSLVCFLWKAKSVLQIEQKKHCYKRH